MSEPRLAYAQRSDATPETELAVVANIYKFALDCHAKNEATRPGSPDDGSKAKEDSADAPIMR